jgi:hypothetical protein
MGEPYQQSATPSWDEAMARAGARLRWLEEHMDGPDQRKRRLTMASETAVAHAALAQGWIAYARELTARQRSSSVPPGDRQSR